MRVGTRLWIAAVVAVFLVLGVAAALRLADERELLAEATLVEKRLSADLVTALLSARASPTPEQARDVLAERLGQSDAAIRVDLIARSKLAPEFASRLAGGETVVHYVDEGQLVIYAPLLNDPDGRALRLTETREPEHAFLRASLLHSAIGASALALVLALMLWGITRRIVTAPLAMLSSTTRRIAAGDLSVRVPNRGGTELSDFAHELNGMTEKLALARRKLEEEAATRVQLLEQLRHAERLRMVGLLSSSFAHELGTPLNVASGHARVIQRSKEVPEALRERANIIIEQVNRMKARIENVLGFVRRKEPARERIELGELAHYAMAMIEPLARRQAVRIQLSRELPAWVRADRSQLLQAVSNLVINALHAMPEGGPLVLHVSERHETGERPGTRSGHFACLAVEDSGPGVSPEAMPHLFEPFFTTRAQNEGTGLGLTVTHGIVQDCGGFIDVTNRPGGGATFTLCFPWANPPDEGSAA